MKAILFFILSITGISLFAQQQLGSDTIRINVTVAQAKYIVDTTGVNPDFVILDIRTPSEYANGHIANAININYYDANFSAQLDALDHNKMYLLHCQSGGRSTPTFAMMQTKHFREIYHMNNGFGTWLTAGYPYVTGYTFAEHADAATMPIVYNNASEHLLNVFSGSAQVARLSIYDLQGKQLMQQTLNPGPQQFDLGNLCQGVFIVNILSADESWSEKIFVK